MSAYGMFPPMNQRNSAVRPKQRPSSNKLTDRSHPVILTSDKQNRGKLYDYIKIQEF